MTDYQTDIQNSHGFAVGDGATVNNYYAQPPKDRLFVNVPPLPPHFTGREALVDAMAQRLISGQTMALSADGLPGVGKTTLAIALARRREVLDHFTAGVLWAGLGRAPDLASLLAEWGDALGLDLTRYPEVADRARVLCNKLGQDRYLLILDDAWQAEALAYFRCGGPGLCYLLTTRNRQIARTFAGHSGVQTVDLLSDDDALVLLTKLAPAACAADPHAAARLVERVGNLPLAIELMGGYLNAPEASAFPDLSAEALAEMADPAHRLALACQRLGSRESAAQTLHQTIELSLTNLPAGAQTAFLALGSLAPKPATFNRAAAEAIAPTDARTLALLISRHLLAQQGEWLALHQTLSDFARAHPRFDPQAITRQREHYLGLVNANRNNWQTIEAVYPQLGWAWQNTPADESELELVWALRVYQNLRGLWADQLAWAQTGLEICRQTGNRQDEGWLLNNIGWVYNSLGQRREALRYFEQALPIFSEVGNRAGEATTLNNIGLVYNRLGQRQEALRYYAQALLICREVGDRAGEATTLNNIGRVYDSLGQRQEALRYFEQALPIFSEVGDRAGEATTLNNIGLVYDNLGQRQEALRYYEQALPIRREVGDRAGEAVTLSNIGAVYHSLGQRQEALRYYEQALPITREVGDKFGESTTRYNMAYIYRAEGDLATAIDHLRQTVALSEAVQSPYLERFAGELKVLEAELAGQ